MRWIFLPALFLFMTGSPLGARPFVFHRGVVNGASFLPQALPNGSIARGSIFSIFGRELGPAAGVSAPALPLGATLAGVSVEVCEGTTHCVPAFPLFVSAGQVNAVMNSSAPLGAVNVRVTYNSEAGNYSPARVTASSFGILTVSSGGFGPAIVTNFVSQTDQPVNSATATARPGQVITIWGTGLGAALNADNAAPQAGDLPVEVEIWIGGVTVSNRLYSGRSPQFPGLDQIVVEIPSTAPAGCYVPVVVRTARQVVSNSSTIAISADGRPCDDPANPLGAARDGGKVGLVLLNRFGSVLNIPPFTTDLVAGVFQNEPAGPWHFNRMYSLPPVGTCTTYGLQGFDLTTDLMARLATGGARLNAGPGLRVTGPASSAQAVTLPRAGNHYGALLGTDLRLDPMLTLFFGGGSSRVNGTGGGDVGAFQVEIPPVPALNWSNRESFARLTRGSAFEVTWSGGDPAGLTLALGFGRGGPDRAMGGFACVARTSSGRFSVPGWASASLPDDGTAQPDGLLSLFALPASATIFTATGLDLGFGLFAQGQTRWLDIR
ncbi:MAG: hypothetical protein K2X35_03975 [Bryobacteraceae bacterium]|nr:hypothetical protein [Bryobacteraceae bacterium]